MAHDSSPGQDRLTVHLEAAGFEPVRTDALEEALQRASGQHQLQEVLAAFDAEVASSLTAADGRLGKAHDVGRALAETCFAPEDQQSFDRAFGPRIVDIKSWLADLASSFPPHASRAGRCWPARSSRRCSRPCAARSDVQVVSRPERALGAEVAG